MNHPLQRRAVDRILSRNPELSIKKTLNQFAQKNTGFVVFRLFKIRGSEAKWILDSDAVSDGLAISLSSLDRAFSNSTFIFSRLVLSIFELLEIFNNEPRHCSFACVRFITNRRAQSLQGTLQNAKPVIDTNIQLIKSSPVSHIRRGTQIAVGILQKRLAAHSYKANNTRLYR